MTFGDFVRTLYAEVYGSTRKGATFEIFIKKMFSSANENVGIQIGGQYKNWMKAPNSSGFNSAYVKLFRDATWNKLPFDDEKFLAFINVNLKNWRSVQHELGKVKADNDPINVVTDDKNIFMASVLCQFKEILKINCISVPVDYTSTDFVAPNETSSQIEKACIPNAPSNTPPNTLPFRAQTFVGRQSELQQMHKNFKSHHACCVMQTLLGLGGFGKTEIALAYARNHAHEYSDGIGYINAETYQSIQSSFYEFAKTVCNARESLGDTGLRNVVLNWLNTHSSWLLILDNVDNEDKDAHKEILSYISQLQTGQVIITTQNSELMMGNVIYVGAFTPDDALKFLTDRFEKSPYSHLIQPEDGNSLTALSRRLGYLPLALEQSVAFMINSGGISCRDYHTFLNNYGIALLNEKLSVSKEYKRTVATTFERSFNRLSVAARHFLNLCAYMSPEKIPLSFFEKQSAKFSAELAESLNQDFGALTILAELVQFSLAKHDNGFINIHRIVQEVLRTKIEADSETILWLEYSVKAVYAEVPHFDEFTDMNRLKQFEDIVVPVASVLSHVREIIKKHFETDEYVKMVELFRYELMIYMKILGIDNSPCVVDVVDTYIKMAKVPPSEKVLLMNSNRSAALSHYISNNFYEAFKVLMKDLFMQTNVATLYPDITDAIKKLNCVFAVLKNLVSGSSYVAAVELMIGYLEAELNTTSHHDLLLFPD